MDKKLVDKLAEKYPKLFQEYGKPPSESCMAWGCECGNGWYNILDDLFNQLSKYDDIILTQVKEKFGTLRFYYRTEVWYDNGNTVKLTEKEEKIWNEIIRGVVSRCENESSQTCEKTGEYGFLHKKGAWLKTLSIEQGEELGFTPKSRLDA